MTRRSSALKPYTGRGKWYKVLEAGGRAPYQTHFKYDLPKDDKPGEWMPKAKVGKIKCQSTGYYLCRQKDLQRWADGRYTIYEAQPRGNYKEWDNKAAFEEVRIIRKVGTMTDQISEQINDWYDDFDQPAMSPKLYFEIIKDHSKLVNPNAAFHAMVQKVSQQFKAHLKKLKVKINHYSLDDMDVVFGWLLCQPASIRKPFLTKSGKRFDMDKVSKLVYPN